MPHDFILEFIKTNAIQMIDPEKIILFGSRARGDQSDRSDYDIAVLGAKQTGWAEFVCFIEEKTPTLLDIDLICYEKASEKIKKSIDEEGLVIYERKS